MIKLEVTDYAVEACSRCACDNITFYDSTSVEESSRMGRLCGTWGGVQYQSTGSSMLISFKSDRNVVNSGFRANYLAVYPSQGKLAQIP